MSRIEIVNAMEQLAQQQAAIAAQLEQLQVRLNQLDDEERHEKISQITELLANANIQQLDYILNYLNAVEEIPATMTATPTPEPVIATPVSENAEVVTAPEVIIIPTAPAEPTTEPIAEPTTPPSTEQANVEDYLINGRIPWTDATISVVGLSHQNMWSIDHDSPQIGDRVTLAPTLRRKRDGSPVAQILAYTTEEEGRAIGTLPQGDSKIAELEAIGAPILKNRDAYADEDMRNGKTAIVVGVIPGRFCFLKLDDEESAPSTPEPVPASEETIAEPEVPEGVERILQGIASDATEARRLFNEQKRDHWTFSHIEEIGRWFKINFLDHRCNSDNWRKSVAIAKAE